MEWSWFRSMVVKSDSIVAACMPGAHMEHKVFQSSGLIWVKLALPPNFSGFSVIVALRYASMSASGASRAGSVAKQRLRPQASEKHTAGQPNVLIAAWDDRLAELALVIRSCAMLQYEQRPAKNCSSKALTDHAREPNMA